MLSANMERRRSISLRVEGVGFMSRLNEEIRFQLAVSGNNASSCRGKSLIPPANPVRYVVQAIRHGPISAGGSRIACAPTKDIGSGIFGNRGKAACSLALVDYM